MKNSTISRAIMLATLFAPVAAHGKPQAADKPEETQPPATGTAQPAPTPRSDEPKPVRPGNGQLAETDLAALAHFHHVNVMEIDLGKMAQAKGSAKVKAYGKMLARDHTRIDRGLVDFAKQRRITIPAAKPKDDAEAAEMKTAMETMDRLQGLDGEAFDREFMMTMIADHERELPKLDTAIANAGDMKLRAALKKAQPLMKKHLDQARKLAPDQARATATAPPPTTNKARK
jgi:putative membrane protein